MKPSDIIIITTLNSAVKEKFGKSSIKWYSLYYRYELKYIDQHP